MSQRADAVETVREPVEWLRVGLAAQRTRAYGAERDILRGPFAQVTWRRITVGGFWFNPGVEGSGLRGFDRHGVLRACHRDRRRGFDRELAGRAEQRMGIAPK